MGCRFIAITALGHRRSGGSPAGFIPLTGVCSFAEKWIACGELVTSELNGGASPTASAPPAEPRATKSAHAPVVVPNAGNAATAPRTGPKTAPRQSERPDTGASGAGMTMLLGLLTLAIGGYRWLPVITWWSGPIESTYLGGHKPLRPACSPKHRRDIHSATCICGYPGGICSPTAEYTV